MKKILIVTEYFYPEEFKINEVALEWKKKGYDVDILTTNPTYPFGELYSNYINKWYTKENWNGLTIYRVKAITGYKSSLFKKLLKYISFMMLGSFISLKIGKKYNYVFGFDVGALTGLVPAVILNQFYKKTVTLWVQDIWPDSVYAYGFKKNKILEFILNNFVRYIYKYTSNFAVTSKGFENRILPYLKNQKKIIHAPNWTDDLDVNLEEFSFSDKDYLHFTFAGNIGTVQNLDNVILGFSSLEDKYLNKIQLNIIGDGSYLSNLKKLVEKNKIKNVIFWGRKPKKEITRYLEASDFLIVSLVDKPIFSLTIPAKTQTYIAIGKPIIGIINGETADIIKEHNIGFCANPNSMNEIKEVFIKAINLNNLEKKHISNISKELTNTMFKKEVIIDKLLKLLRQE